MAHVPTPGYAGYEERIIREHGRCICPSDVCMAEPNDKGEQCGYCANVDPEWPCPHDPFVVGPFVLGDE